MKKKKQIATGLCGSMLVVVLIVGLIPKVSALQPPVANANGPYIANECEEIMCDASASYDPDHDTLQFRWDFTSDGIWDTTWSISPYGFSTWYDDFQGIATVQVTDGTFTVSDTAEIIIMNVNPQILIDEITGLPEITGPVDPVETGTETYVTVLFFDGDLRSWISSTDTFVATFDWGDSIQSYIALPSGSQVVTGTHVYTTPGVYTVTITITDDDGGFATGTYSFIVVYEPDVQPGTGFVTGGGWIYSQPGMYRPDPTAEGKTNFGFVSKYKKGHTIPTGNTEFNYQEANLNFHSETYEWLTVTGNTARYKGSGTINGEGDYGFMVTVIDSGHDSDTFRIKIWDKTNGVMIYDNNGDTILGGGEIVIHRI
jgi:hypothetical protein